jgi:hypothetical protein
VFGKFGGGVAVGDRLQAGEEEGRLVRIRERDGVTATDRKGGLIMKNVSWGMLLGRLCPSLLLAVVLLGCAPPPSPDPAAWQQWVHDEAKNNGPAWQQPGVEAALVQFGYDYRDQRDRQRCRDDGIDQQLVAQLRAELIRKGVPVNSSSGVSWVDAAAAMARNTLCPEDVTAYAGQHAPGAEWWRWVVGSTLGAGGILLAIWLLAGKPRGHASSSA